MRIAARIGEVVLEDGPYAGVRASFRRNVPMGVLMDLNSLDVKDMARTWDTLARLFVSSNLETDDGVAIDVSKADEWRSHVPADLVVALLKAVGAELKDPFAETPSSSSPPPSPATA